MSLSRWLAPIAQRCLVPRKQANRRLALRLGYDLDEDDQDTTRPQCDAEVGEEVGDQAGGLVETRRART